MFDTGTADNLETQIVETELLIGRLRAHQLGPTSTPQPPKRWLARPDRHTLTLAFIDAVNQGTVSFDRASATLRLADAGADEHTLRLSAGLDVLGIHRRAARHRRRTPRSHIEAFEARHLVLQPNLDESSWRLHGLLAGYEGRVVEESLIDKADSFPVDPDLPRESRAARAADALAALCTESLGPTESGALASHRHRSPRCQHAREQRGPDP